MGPSNLKLCHKSQNTNICSIGLTNWKFRHLDYKNCHNFNFGFMIKVWEQERMWVKRVSWDSNTFWQMCESTKKRILQVKKHFGNCSPIRVLNFLDKNASNKKGPNWSFNTPLEGFWNVNIENEITFFIWSCKLVLMPKERLKI